MRRLTSVTLLSSCLVVWAADVLAAPIAVGGGWSTLTWDCPPPGEPETGVCEDLTGIAFDPSSFEFTLLTPGVVRFTDAYVAGDVFALSVTGTAVFDLVTSPVASDGFKNIDPANLGNFDFFFATGQFSRVEFALAPGTYSIHFLLLNLAPVCANPDGLCTNPTGVDWLSGSAGLRVDPVPEPASMVLLGSGLAGVAAAVRRRRRLRQGTHASA